ncbi:MAG: 30S ribosomal protein S21 [Verrucomicrobiaceae bacterium]|nr:30S ribosomal protein S21 [Verrucomicrobiaceae bacterium]
MPEVDIKKGEPIDRALKRLKSKMETEGIMEEMRRLRSFETPTQKAKRKARSNAKRNKNKFRFTLRTSANATPTTAATASASGADEA